MSYQAAIEAGVDILDTAMSPFAMGTSQPPTESVVASLIGTPCDTGIDLIRLRAARNACIQIREKYAGLLNPISERVDSNVLLYQLPGRDDLEPGLPAAGTGCPRTGWTMCLPKYPGYGKTSGYPPLVTPTSQIVGTQAVLNVLVNGERYRNVTKEVKDYIHGQYGKSPAPVSAADPHAHHRE